MVSFSKPPSSPERKDKSWKGIPLEGDWNTRERGDLSVGKDIGFLYPRSALSLAAKFEAWGREQRLN